MYLYRLRQSINSQHGEKINPSDLPIPMESFNNAIPAGKIPTIDMEELETVWGDDGHLVIIMTYLEDCDIYYLLLPTEYSLESLDDINQRDKMHHCDYYMKPFLDRFVDRFQRRVHTRKLVKDIILYVNGSYGDELNPMYNISLVEHLTKLSNANHTYNDPLYSKLDGSFLQNLVCQTKEKVEEEERFCPGGAGFKKAKEHFESFS